MKKIICITLTLSLVFLLFGCNIQKSENKTKNAKIDIGKSSIYSEKDRKAAVDFILKYTENDNSIAKLYSLTYAGDEKSKKETEYYKDTDNLSHDELIVFYIDYRSSISDGSNGYDSNYNYSNVSMILGRDDGGEWIYVTGGYC